jgi:hypothetical protein
MIRDTKYWENRLGTETTDSSFQDHMDFRGLPELNDAGLAYYLRDVTGISMLDLNETEITNEAIKELTTLLYVDELRLKGCVEIDDDCIPDLNKLVSLKFLHVKDTNITIDGILQLNDLTDLTTLLFSVDDTAVIKDKMLLLKEMLPDCNFVVNGVPYVF